MGTIGRDGAKAPYRPIAMSATAPRKTLLLTGATGLIGKELAEPLLAAGFDVHAITIDRDNPSNGIAWHPGSLFDDAFVRDVVAALRPTHLLHMAWATTGDYLTADINYDFLAAGIRLARHFADQGGRRAVFAGTCFEYRFGDAPLREDGPLEAGRNAYTHCKNALRETAARLFAAHGVSFGYGRIFYVYGRREAPTRLVGRLVDRLPRGLPVEITAGPLRRDYLYAKDIAGAFAALLASDAEGPVNICTGHAVSIRDLVLAFARRIGREDLVVFRDDCAGQPPVIVGDNARLSTEVGFVPRYGLDQAVDEILADARAARG